MSTRKTNTNVTIHSCGEQVKRRNGRKYYPPPQYMPAEVGPNGELLPPEPPEEVSEQERKEREREDEEREDKDRQASISYCFYSGISLPRCPSPVNACSSDFDP